MIKSLFGWLPLILIFIFCLEASVALAEDRDNVTPFEAGRMGSVATIDFHISLTRNSLMHNTPEQVALVILPPRQSESNSDIIDKYLQLYHSLTGKDYIYNGDIPRESHKGIKVRVIWRDSNGFIIRQRDVYSDDGDGRIKESQGASFTLDGLILTPGDYKVTVEALENDSRFDGTFKTVICIGYIVH